jgi:hypothetical protein
MWLPQMCLGISYTETELVACYREVINRLYPGHQPGWTERKLDNKTSWGQKIRIPSCSISTAREACRKTMSVTVEASPENIPNILILSSWRSETVSGIIIQRLRQNVTYSFPSGTHSLLQKSVRPPEILRLRFRKHTHDMSIKTPSNKQVYPLSTTSLLLITCRGLNSVPNWPALFAICTDRQFVVYYKSQLQPIGQRKFH